VPTHDSRRPPVRRDKVPATGRTRHLMPRRTPTRVKQDAPTVQAAIASLRSTGSVDEPARVADAMEAVLEFALDAVGGPAQAGSKVPFAVPLDSGVHARAYASDLNLSDLVAEGLTGFAAGEWEPSRPSAGYRRGVNLPPKSTLNLTVPKDVVAEAEEAADRMVASRGWPTKRGSKLTARVVAAQWLARQFPDPNPASDVEEPLPRGNERLLEVPRVVREAIRSRAKESGALVEDVIDEGFTKFLAGEFDPVAVVWPSSIAGDKGLMKMKPNNDLFEQVKAMRERGETSLWPMQVAMAYLLDQFGIDVNDVESSVG